MQAERYFSSDPAQLPIALRLYESVAGLPLVCPHGHVPPALFAEPAYQFGNPVELLVQPDHYLLRMLNSDGIPYEQLWQKENPREVWQLFAERFYLYRGTPSGVWLREELNQVFGVDEKLNGENAQRIYDRIAEQLSQPSFSPRELYHQFNIEVLCTTDAATDTLEAHKVIQSSGWTGRILPTFRPDAVVNLDAGGWCKNIEKLSEVSGIDVNDYPSYIQALEQRRAFFKQMGAKATDHSALCADTRPLTPAEAEQIFQRALRGESSAEDAARFTAHMLMEMARMSVEDGLVMQLHTGSLRNYDAEVYGKFGTDVGADIPLRDEFTRNLAPLLNAFGNHPGFRLIVFTLDETVYARELAPLAGFYQAMKLGPPWWFHDSLNGMRRYFDQMMETAGIYNTAGFNDDTRAFLSIPARHDLWRRASCDWVAGLHVRHIIDEEDAFEMARAMAYELAKKAYNL